jgi:hypothetical protein
MANPDKMEAVKSDLAALNKDIKGSKVRQTLDRLEMVDGKLSATFCINGLPSKKDNYSESYRNIPKIFNDWDEFSVFGKTFFGATDEELIKMAKTSK